MGLLDRFETAPGQHRPRIVRNGLITLGILLGGLYFAYSGGTIPFWPKSGDVVYAEFRTAANVSPGKTPVRVEGIDVGSVEEVERLDGGRGVRVKMRLDEDEAKGLDLRKDARADILWRTLLGFGFYIQLEQGASEEKLADESTIPMDRTTAQVELDQVLQSVDAPSREGVQTLFKEFDIGFGEDQPGRAVDAAGPAMRNVAPGLDALRGVRAGDLTQTVRDASRLMGALAKSEQQLGEVVTHADTTLGVTAAKRAALESVLANGPSALQQTTDSMRRFRTTLAELDPVARDLRPGARVIDDTSRAVRPALKQLQPVLDDARPLFRDLNPALNQLGGAARQGVPLMRDLNPTLDRAVNQIFPELEKKGPLGLKLYETIGPTAATVAGASQLNDANGHVVRFNALTAGERSLSFLPCTTDLFKGKVDCSDLQKVIAGAFFGVPPKQLNRSIGLTSGPSDDGGGGGSSSGSTGSTGSSGDEAPALDAPMSGKTKKAVKKVAGNLMEITF